MFKEKLEPAREVEPEQEIREEITEMPKEEREKIGFGLNNMGFYTQERKNSFFSKVFEGAAKQFDKKSTMGRWLESFSQDYTKDAEKARKKMEQIEKGKKHRFGNIVSLTGNVLRYSRVVADVVGYTAGSPFRYVMMAGMFFSRGAEAAKEARLKNEEVIDKTRVHDIDQAAEEAWKVYGQAKAGKEEVSKEDLEKAYQENIPEDLLKRLKKGAEPGTASGILQKIIRKDVELSVKGIEKKIKKIETDEKLSSKEKKLQQEKIINKYSKHLNDLDAMVSQYGTVDGLAMGAKYTKTAAKAAVGAMMVETAGLAIHKLWESLPNIMSTTEASAADLETAEGGKVRMPIIKEEVPAAIPPEVAKAEQFQIAEKVEIKRGDSIWSVAEKYLKGNTVYQKLIEIGDKDTIEALETYNIDRVKDIIVANPQAYGLLEGVDVDKLNIGQLKGINWEKAFADTFPEGKGLTDGLNKEQIESIVGNNKTLRTFFQEHPDAPRTSENYEDILKGKGITGEVAEAKEVVPPEPAEEVEEVAKEKLPSITEAQINKARINLMQEYKMTEGEARNVLEQKVGDFVNEIPKDWNKAVEGFTPGMKIKGHGFFSAGEYKKYWQLANDLRNTGLTPDAGPTPEEMNMTVGEFLGRELGAEELLSPKKVSGPKIVDFRE